MKKLLGEIGNASGKTAYQSYAIEHGIERFTVLVPAKVSKIFEQEFVKAKGTKASLIEVVKRHGGIVK